MQFMNEQDLSLKQDDSTKSRLQLPLLWDVQTGDRRKWQRDTVEAGERAFERRLGNSPKGRSSTGLRFVGNSAALWLAITAWLSMFRLRTCLLSATVGNRLKSQRKIGFQTATRDAALKLLKGSYLAGKLSCVGIFFDLFSLYYLFCCSRFIVAGLHGWAIRCEPLGSPNVSRSL